MSDGAFVVLSSLYISYFDVPLSFVRFLRRDPLNFTSPLSLSLLLHLILESVFEVSSCISHRSTVTRAILFLDPSSRELAELSRVSFAFI